MENQPTIFNHPDFGRIRTAGTPDKPMFCLADVCKALEIENGRDVKSRLNPKGVATNDTLTNGGRQKLLFINEPNLYKCIFQSRKDEAQKFQDWIFEEVLPSIRNTGQYRVAHTETELRQICTLQAQNIELHEEMDKMRANAESMKESYEKALNVLGAAFSMLPNLATTSDISKRYGMTAKQLNDKLEEVGIIYRSGGNIYLAEEYAGKGIAVDYIYQEDDEKASNYLRWTKPGQTFLFLLVKHGYNVDFVWDMFDRGKSIVTYPTH